MCMICQIGRSNAHDFTNGVINMSNDNQLHVYGGYFGVDMIIVCWATTTIFSCVNDVAREVMGDSAYRGCGIHESHTQYHILCNHRYMVDVCDMSCVAL